ncbi:unnamed protein product [Cuscuta campestris]|uniref:Uncharacterized protein n=1 Tax=Cuscuta campestris TaxID=132261 RepID=A0A484KR81_9ASTE|nr:unnamed protein product [Cuscuta campestris]
MSTNALDALIGLLEDVLYGEIDLDEGVCGVYDHVEELIKTRSFRHTTGQPNYDSDLHAFDVEISCSIQDLVRGPPILPSLIPWELQNFRTNMMNAIRNLINAPLLAHMVTIQNTESHEKESKDDSSVELYVGDNMDSGPELINADDEGSGDNMDSGPKHINADDEGSNVMGKNKEFALLEGVDKVANEDCVHTDNSISLDTIALFDIAGIIKSEHLISKKIVRCMFGLLFYFCHYTSSEKLLKDWSTNVRLFWFSTFSHVQKLEWEPPP